jgi:hypothetical protein
MSSALRGWCLQHWETGSLNRENPEGGVCAQFTDPASRRVRAKSEILNLQLTPSATQVN